jgi:hypothetical protein
MFKINTIRQILVTLARTLTYCRDQFLEASAKNKQTEQNTVNQTYRMSDNIEWKRHARFRSLTGRTLPLPKGNSPGIMLFVTAASYWQLPFALL